MVTSNTVTLSVQLGALDDDIKRAVASAVKDGIDDMESIVKSTAPKVGDVTPKSDGGGYNVKYNIANYTYRTFSNDGMDAEFGISDPAATVAAYIEYGTGNDAKSFVPTLEDEFQKNALQFYKNGKGRIIHQPFFIPAWYRVRDAIVQEAQNNLDKLTI